MESRKTINEPSTTVATSAESDSPSSTVQPSVVTQAANVSTTPIETKPTEKSEQPPAPAKQTPPEAKAQNETTQVKTNS